MEAEKRLIDVEVLKKDTCKWCNEHYPDDPCEPSDCPAMEYINNLPTVDAVETPDCQKCAFNDGIAYWHQCDGCIGNARNNFVPATEVKKDEE